MGRRGRQRAREGSFEPLPEAETSCYTSEDGDQLELRGMLTLATRREYAAIGGTREDAWQRAVEFLFERLAVSWRVAGVDYSGQRELLGRLRVASHPEREFVRGALREHCAEHFPDVAAP
jgi:hypothetical protein